jgi:hypothetical protein
MTPQEYEWQEEQLQEIADQARDERAKSGRDIREILQALRDEGYIDCSNEALERCAKMADEPRAAIGAR